MKRFMLMHFGFEKPTPDIMAAWGKWFESIADRTVENGGFRSAREISHEGTRDLPMGMDSITGYSIIHAESLDEAEELARSNPFIASIRIYELMEK
ncbi:MAG: YciI family protein [Gammaproteobacteria bacterium]|nr:YciI family protein [Gammaproteobacteria bacterium]